MPKLIINLIPHSYTFRNAVMRYCHDTGNPTTPKHYEAIFFQCLSQILHKMDRDGQAFLMNLMELPAWGTIHYLDTPIDYDITETFRSEVRAFGICIWNELITRHITDEPMVYLLESCDMTMAVIGAYIDSDNV